MEFPHTYRVTGISAGEGLVDLESESLTPLRSAPPVEFGGPGDRWSPETLLAGAVADCFLLTFHAVARASRLPWTAARCEVTATLDRIDKAVQFTAFEIRARIEVPAAVNPADARRVAEKAERNCLITNSLKGSVHFTADVHVCAVL